VQVSFRYGRQSHKKIAITLLATTTGYLLGRVNAPHLKPVPYYKVSTQKQGASGLGLDAQRAAVQAFFADPVLFGAEQVKIESGQQNQRPQLLAAIAEARRVAATLLITNAGGKACADICGIELLNKAPRMNKVPPPPAVPAFKEPKEKDATVAAKFNELTNLEGLEAFAVASAYDKAK
jgi:hypothetical protein